MEGCRMQMYLTKRNFLLVFIVFVTLTLLFVLYDNLHFRLKDTSPSLKNVATSSVEIRFHFSQPIKSVKSITFNDSDVTSSVLIDNKTVTVPIDISLSKSSTYKIVLKSIDSEWFSNKIDTVERSFTPKYIDFNKLSDEEQKAQIDASNSGQVDDKFVDENVFPIFNDRWQIEATVIPTDRVTVLQVSFLEEIPDYDNGGVIEQVSDDTADKYEQEIHAEIKKRGGNPNDYSIVYKTNKYLSDKYSDADTHYHD